MGHLIMQLINAEQPPLNIPSSSFFLKMVIIQRLVAAKLNSKCKYLTVEGEGIRPKEVPLCCKMQCLCKASVSMERNIFISSDVQIIFYL